MALEHPLEEWVCFSFGKTEHACVTGAYRSEGTGGVYLSSAFKNQNNPYPVTCRNIQSFQCAHKSCTKVYFRMQTSFHQAFGDSAGGTCVLGENNHSTPLLSAHLLASELPDFNFHFFLFLTCSKSSS